MRARRPPSTRSRSHSRNSGLETGKVVAFPTQPGTPDLLVTEYLRRYANPNTAKAKGRLLRSLFAYTGKTDPADLTAEDIIEWCNPPGKRTANNSVRDRVSMARTFLRWCAKRGLADPAVTADALDDDSPLRGIHRTYGKVQDRNPARWLTRPEIDALLAACDDDTDEGLRDQLAIRLGLLGVRAIEIVHMTVGNYDPRTHRLAWIGKKDRPRSATANAGFAAAFADWHARYAAALGHAPAADLPIICRMSKGRNSQLVYGEPMADAISLRRLVARRAAAAGIGHLSPHDLRRTLAGVLHSARSADGGHLFDLLDIQKVLGHSDPATTMRSYLDPMDTGVADAAAAALDF